MVKKNSIFFQIDKICPNPTIFTTSGHPARRQLTNRLQFGFLFGWLAAAAAAPGPRESPNFLAEGKTLSPRQHQSRVSRSFSRHPRRRRRVVLIKRNKTHTLCEKERPRGGYFSPERLNSIDPFFEKRFFPHNSPACACVVEFG